MTTLFKLVADITCNGKYPFIILADFNAKPSEVGSLHWLSQLKASVLTTGEPTCFHGDSESTIDCCVISDTLLPCIKSLEIIQEVPWGPHALLKLTITKGLEEASIDKQVLARNLNNIPELIQGLSEEDIMYEWGEAEIEAQGDIEKQELQIEELLDPEEHSKDSSLALFRWCRTMEYWYIRLWNKKFPDEFIFDKSPYLGRGMTPTFQKIPLKKEGNKDVFGNIDFGSHETVACRSILLIQRILRNYM